MEYEELKSLWDKYDNKLDNLERLNKKLITETLIKKPQKKLNWFIFQSLYGLIATPIILIVALHEYFKIENIDLLFIIGSILISAVVINMGYIQYKCYLLLKCIDLQNDSIIDAAQKVNNFKKVISGRQKSYLITIPVLFIGVLLFRWKTFNFNNNSIMFLIGLFIFTILHARWHTKLYSQRIERLNGDILELEEYKE